MSLICVTLYEVHKGYIFVSENPMFSLWYICILPGIDSSTQNFVLNACAYMKYTKAIYFLPNLTENWLKLNKIGGQFIAEYFRKKFDGTRKELNLNEN